MRKNLNMEENARPWTGHRTPQGVPKNCRPFDLIDVVYQSWKQRHPDASEEEMERPDLFADTSQAVQRLPGAERHPMGAHQANGDFSYEANRVLSAKDLWLQLVSQLVRLRLAACFVHCIL